LTHERLNLNIFECSDGLSKNILRVSKYFFISVSKFEDQIYKIKKKTFIYMIIFVCVKKTMHLSDIKYINSI